jgi:hypothetical protein
MQKVSDIAQYETFLPTWEYKIIKWKMKKNNVYISQIAFLIQMFWLY